MTLSARHLRNSVVRVRRADGEHVGLGYRVSDNVVLTCSHVVAAALGMPAESPEPPEGVVWIDTPFLGTSGDGAPVPAHVVPRGWFPKSARGFPSDVSVLRTSQPLPVARPLAALDPAFTLSGARFEAFGSGVGYEDTLNVLSGRIEEQLPTGLWQMNMTGSTYPVQPGCSGAPVVSIESGTVIGLIAQSEIDPAIDAAFLIPSAYLREALTYAAVAEPEAERALAPLLGWIDRHFHLVPAQLRDRVAAFVRQYAGTESQPAAFVGRSSEQEWLDARLDDGRGRIIVATGAAGSGKSALLLHWMARRLAAPDELRLLFLPISIRYRTNDEEAGLRIIHAQLSGFFRDLALPPYARPTAAELTQRVHDGWSLIRAGTQRFVVVVDGVDEAAGSWLGDRVLPYELPDQVSLVLSLRVSVALEDNEIWADLASRFSPRDVASLALGALSREEVGEALDVVGIPAHAPQGRAALLDELYRLTDRGDPLLLALWCPALRRDRDELLSSAQELERLPAGLEGFVQLFLRDQESVWRDQSIDVRRRDFERLLRLLSFAHGPLAVPEIEALFERLPGFPSWNRDDLERILRASHRLLVETGADRSFTFVHPRIGDFFRRSLGNAERALLSDAYLRWGVEVVRQIREAPGTEARAAAYLLHHYITHVVGSDLPHDEILDRHLVPLLHVSWQRAWMAEEGSYGGFVRNVDRIREELERSDRVGSGGPFRIAELVRAALIQASVRSMTVRLVPRLIELLVRTGVWPPSRGLAVCGELTVAEDRTEACALLARHLPAEGVQAAVAISLDTVRFERSFDTTLLAGTPEWMSAAIAWTVPFLRGRPGLMRRAVAAAVDIWDEETRATALIALADCVDKDGELLRTILSAAAGMRTEKWYVRVLAAIESHSSEAERRLDAVFSKNIDGPPATWRAWFFVSVLPWVGEARRLRVLDHAVAAAEGEGDPYQRGWLLVNLLPFVSGDALDRMLESCLTALERTPPDNAPQVARGWLGNAPREKQLPFLPRIVRFLEGTADLATRVELCADVARWGPEAMRPDALRIGFAVVNQIADLGRRWIAYAGLADWLNEPERSQRLSEVLSIIANNRAAWALQYMTRIRETGALWPHIVDAVASLPVGADIGYTVRNLAARATDALVAERTLALLDRIDDRKVRADIIHHASVRAEASATRRALLQELARTVRIDDDSARARALVAIAALASEGKEELLGPAMAACGAIRDEEGLLALLLAAIPQLHDAERAAATERLRDLASRCTYLNRRAEALTALLPLVDERERPAAFEEACAAAMRIDQRYWRVHALIALLASCDRVEWQRVAALIRAEIARENNHQWRAEWLFSLYVHAEASERRSVFAEALAAARAIAACQRLFKLAAAAEGEERSALLNEGLAAAELETNPLRRGYAYVAAMPLLPESDRPGWTSLALSSIGQVRKAEERCLGLLAVLPWMSDAAMGDVLSQAIEAADRCDSTNRFYRLRQFVHPILHIVCNGEIATTRSKVAIRAVHYVLREAAKEGRRGTLDLVRDLAPALVRLGGEGAAPQIGSAIRDACAWWP